MKLKTIPTFFNKSINISEDRSIQFDSTGTFETEDEKLGMELLEKYPSFVFAERGTPDSQDKKLAQEINQELVNSLNREIYELKEQNQALKSEKEGLANDVKAWQDKIEEFSTATKTAEALLDDERVTNKKIVQELQLKISLMGSTLPALQKLCEDSNFKKEDWGSLTKEKLIEYILGKS